MKKTILIPTDFTIESLNLVKSALENNGEQDQYNIILLHGVHLADSISDLLYFSKAAVIKSLSNATFEEACDVIKNKFAREIDTIRKDIFTGKVQSAFNNYIEANNIEDTYIPNSYTMQLPDKKSFDILPFIEKSKLKKHRVDWTIEAKLPEKGKLAEIFFSETSVSTNS